ncbi:MAG: hypothetical protein K6F23_15030 [Solobacterium sp.]|nr:hypothetical protein [Solobacterium sp.]
MANIVLFKIGNTDLTDYLDIQGYNVNKTEEFSEWIDANYIHHRNVVRTRLSGRLKLGFKSTAAVTNFLNVLDSNVQPGNYYPASVFANNDNTLHTANVFLDGVAEIKRDLVNNRVWHEYEIDLEER